jgi:hypothetical protein
LKGPEARLQEKITSYLSNHDVFYTKTQGGTPGTATGTPDIITIDKHGRYFGLEIKRPDGKGVVSVEQKAVGKQIMRNGGRWEVVASFEDFERAWKDVEKLF